MRVAGWRIANSCSARRKSENRSTRAGEYNVPRCSSVSPKSKSLAVDEATKSIGVSPNEFYRLCLNKSER